MALGCFLAVGADAQPTNTFTVASYNVENWLLMERYGNPDEPKPQSAKQVVLQVLNSIQPDVVGLCEVGTTNDLEEISRGLHDHGLDYTHREWIQGGDQVRHVALLSRFPIIENNSRTNDSYLLGATRKVIERGILDVAIQVNDNYRFRAIMVHLKSKRAVQEGDQASMRLNEARLLRRHVEATLEREEKLNLLVMGDLNDTPDSEPVRTVIGSGSLQLFDLMPVNSRGLQGTHFWRYGREFSRIDYLLTSPGMSNEFLAGSARIADPEGWIEGSDHLAIYARFVDHDLDESWGASTGSGALEAPPPQAPGSVSTVSRWLIRYIVLVVILGFVALGYVAYRLFRPPGTR